MKLTLYKRVILLIVLVIFVSLFTAYAFILGITDTLIAQRMENGSQGIASRIANSKLIRESLLNPAKSSEIESLVTAVSESTVSNIIIFTKDKKVIFLSNSFAKDREQFIKNAQETAFTGPIRVSLEDDLRSRSYYSRQIAEKIYDQNNQEIGTVVVADVPSDYEFRLDRENLFLILWASLIGLMVGILGAIALVKNTKNILLGLEPEEIAQIMQERSAMIDSVQEGILCVDNNGEITLVNSSAKKIFEHAGLRTDNLVGVNLDKIYNSSVNKVLTTGRAHLNYEEKINNITIITNQVPVIMNGKIAGAITTFRLKTEIEALAQELTGVKEYADALRAQTHEFLNKMHVILGLIKIEAYDELRQYIKNVAMASSEESEYIMERLNDPVLSGFIIGKISRARELAIDFSLTEESNLPTSIAPGHIDKIITIIGNLLNNAFDALKNCDSERIVLLTILTFEDELVFIVEDSGAGIPKENLEDIFQKGFSTKGPENGFGLYIVKQAVSEFGGSIEVESSPNEGTVFTVKIPNMINGNGEE